MGINLSVHGWDDVAETVAGDETQAVTTDKKSAVANSSTNVDAAQNAAPAQVVTTNGVANRYPANTETVSGSHDAGKKNAPLTTAGEYEQKSIERVDYNTAAADKQSRIDMAAKFFDLLFGNVCGIKYGYLWLKRGDKERITIPFMVTDRDDREEMSRKAIEFNDKGFDVYIGVNCGNEKLGANERYKAEIPKDWTADKPPVKLVTVQTATVTDIDVFGGNHTDAGKYPPTFDDAKSFLPFTLSLLVNSGYGLHGYCIYSEPVIINDNTRDAAQKRNEKFLDVIRSRAGIYSKVVDGVGDLPRILRVPGTFNHKVKTAPALCRVVEVNDVCFTAAELDEKLAPLMTQRGQGLFATGAEKNSSTTDNQTARKGKENSSTTDNQTTAQAQKNFLTVAAQYCDTVTTYDLFRAVKMLEVLSKVNHRNLKYNQWLVVNTACKNIGVDYSVVDAFNQCDPTNYNAGENQRRWKGLNDSSIDIKSLHRIAKQFGYDENATWHKFHDGRKSSTTSPAANTGAATGAGIDYEKLFDGLKPIKPCAGSILGVVDADTKSVLESLFVDRNFSSFVSQVTEMQTTDNDDAQIDSTPLGEVKTALTWLIGKLYPLFNGDNDRMKKFIVERLQAAKADGDALLILGDAEFWGAVTHDAAVVFDGKTFHFDEKFRRELIACAQHKSFYKSLIRFDYQRLENFLRKDFTDMTCAELLIDVQKNLLLFDVTQGTWYTWRGNFWQAVDIKTREPLYAAWLPLARKARIFAELDRFKKYSACDDYAINNPDIFKFPKSLPAEKYKRLQRAAKIANSKLTDTRQLEQTRKIDTILTQAAGLPETKIETKQLDTDKYLFNCANVTIDLRTMETYKARQSDLITLSTTTIYEPKATCADWDNFLVSAIPNDELREWLQRFFGYCLSGDVSEHIFLFIHGIGGSGKTTFLNAIGNTLGDYAEIFSVDALCVTKKQRDGDEPSPALAKLRACRLARSSETQKNRRLDEAVIKRWTGSDPLAARELHKPPFKFNPNFKIVVDGNFALRVSDIHDDGLRRRLRIAPFNNPPTADKADKNLSDKLSTPQARSAILNWLLDGWRNYQKKDTDGRKKGLQDIPVVMKNALNIFYAANDFMADFLESHAYQVGEPKKYATPKQFCLPVMVAWQCYRDWQQRTPTASILGRADFVDAFLRATQNDGVKIEEIGHTKYFVGCTLDTDGKNNPPF